MQKQSTNQLQIGLIKSFNKDRGFGIILTPLKKEYFVHITQIRFNNVEPTTGLAIVFESGFDSVRSREIATKCSLFEKREHWLLLFSILSLPDVLQIEVKVSERVSSGRTVVRSSFKDISIQQCCAN